jgi:hypothetical protein
MTAFGPTAVYLLCLLASLLCAWLLLRGYFRDRSRLQLWVAVSFVCFALNNMALVADMVLFPTSVDLLIVRQITAALAIGVLLYAFIWEIEP